MKKSSWRDSQNVWPGTTCEGERYGFWKWQSEGRSRRSKLFETDGIRRAKPRERALSAADTIVREKRRGMMRRSTSDLRVSESSDREPSQPQRGQQEIL